MSWILTLAIAIGWMGVSGCGTTTPFSRGESSTPTPAPTTPPSPTTLPPGDDDTTTGGDDDATSGDDDATGSGDDDASAPPASPTPTPTPTPVPVSFAKDVKPYLDTCISCHGGGNASATTAWNYTGGSSAYTQTMPEVDVKNPSKSSLLTNMAGVDHGGGTIYATSSKAYKNTLAWIENGAPNN